MQTTTAQPQQTSTPAKRLRGYLGKVHAAKGFTFVHTDDGAQYFLHFRDLEGGDAQMIAGSIVEFTPVRVDLPGKCDRATNAVVISKPAPKNLQQ